MFAFALAKQTTSQIPLQVNKQGTFKVAKNYASSNRLKEIDIEYLLVREQVENKNLNLQYRQTLKMATDIFTKQSQWKLFNWLVQTIEVIIVNFILRIRN